MRRNDVAIKNFEIFIHEKPNFSTYSWEETVRMYSAMFYTAENAVKYELQILFKIQNIMTDRGNYEQKSREVWVFWNENSLTPIEDNI